MLTTCLRISVVVIHTILRRNAIRSRKEYKTTTFSLRVCRVYIMYACMGIMMCSLLIPYKPTYIRIQKRTHKFHHIHSIHIHVRGLSHMHITLEPNAVGGHISRQLTEYSQQSCSSLFHFLNGPNILDNSKWNRKLILVASGSEGRCQYLSFLR